MYNQFVANSEAKGVNLELKWSWLSSELQLALRNFERAEGDEHCAQKCRRELSWHNLAWNQQ